MIVTWLSNDPRKKKKWLCIKKKCHCKSAILKVNVPLLSPRTRHPKYKGVKKLIETTNSNPGLWLARARKFVKKLNKNSIFLSFFRKSVQVLKTIVIVSFSAVVYGELVQHSDQQQLKGRVDNIRALQRYLNTKFAKQVCSS